MRKTSNLFGFSIAVLTCAFLCTCEGGKDNGGCDTGWAGADCDACDTDYYGPTCEACLCQSGTCNDGLAGDGHCSSGIVGTWSVTSILEDGVEVFAGSESSVTFTFARDGTITVSTDGDESSGLYALTGDSFLWLCDPNCDEAKEYEIAGDTLVIAFDEGSEVWTLQLIEWGDNSGVMGMGTGIAGSWSITSVTDNGVEVFANTGCSATFTLETDGTFTSVADGDVNHLFCEDTTSCVSSEMYALTGDSILWVCDPACNEPHDYEVTGDTFILTISDADTGVVRVFTGRE